MSVVRQHCQQRQVVETLWGYGDDNGDAANVVFPSIYVGVFVEWRQNLQ